MLRSRDRSNIAVLRGFRLIIAVAEMIKIIVFAAFSPPDSLAISFHMCYNMYTILTAGNFSGIS